MSPVPSFLARFEHSPGPTLLGLWTSLGKIPGGSFGFSKLLRFVVPYTGSVSPEILELAPGIARARMRDRRGVRNHLRSVHAVALMNLGELSTGLAVLSAQGQGVRAILVGFSMEFRKKARGVITSEARVDLASVAVKAGEPARDVEVEGRLTNEAGECVAIARALWRVSHV